MDKEKRVEQIVGPAADVHHHRDHIVRAIQRSCRDARIKVDKCLHECNVYETINAAANYLISRPLLMVAVIAVISAIAIPVLIFTAFAVTTIACTFTGFVVIEGTILAFGSVVLCGVLLFVITSMMILGTFMVSAYYISLKLYSVTKKF